MGVESSNKIISLVGVSESLNKIISLVWMLESYILHKKKKLALSVTADERGSTCTVHVLSSYINEQARKCAYMTIVILIND
jgi:hypothetical protein